MMRPSDEAPQALEGLDSTGVIVVVSEEIPVAEPAMQTAVEQRLRQAGLKVQTSPLDANWVFWVSVEGLKDCSRDGDHIGYSTRVGAELTGQQVVTLPSGEPGFGQVKLWTSGLFGGTGPELEELGQAVERAVEQVVDEFLNDWLAGNPER
jgi:hypothetical protein